MRTVTFVAMDDTPLVFKVPKGMNPHLILKAVEKLHKGEDADLVQFGLTKRETELVAQIKAGLEEHAPKRAETAV
jgi:hypothetical protein